MNTFGTLFRLTTFGESHGPAMGAVVDGCPSGVSLTTAQVQAALDRRRPGQSALVTPRNEPDQVELLSGVFEDRTLGTPIGAIVRNTNQRSQDYAQLAKEDRPGHADKVWRERYGHRDPRGGGRTSGRETLCRVIGGVVAEALLARDFPALRTVAWVSQVASVVAGPVNPTRAQVDAHPTRCPVPQAAKEMEARILAAKEAGDSLGGTIDVRVEGMPIGWGEPVFGKLKATLAAALGSIGAVTGVTWGLPGGMKDLERTGLDFHRAPEEGASEVYGGIQGGLSNGEPLEARVYFKPPATLAAHATSGRHDPCILPRAVPVVEAMTALVLADFHLLHLARPHRA